MNPTPSFRARLAFVLLLLASLLSSPVQTAFAQTDGGGFVRILSVKCSQTEDGTCIPVGINNEPTNTSKKGQAAVSRILPGWWSAQWVMETEHGATTFRSRFTNEWLAAFYDKIVTKGEDDTYQWSVRLVKPGEVVTNYHIESGTWQTAPIEQFPGSIRWRVITAKDGTQIIVNQELVGLRAANQSSGKMAAGSFGALVLTQLKFDLKDDGSEIVPDKGEWRITKTDEFVAAKQAEKIRINGGTVDGPPMAINIETGTPSAGPVQPGWLSAQWMEERAATDNHARVSFFRNVWTGKYLGVANGALAMMDRDAAADSRGGYQAPYGWQVVGGAVPGHEGLFRYSLKNVKTGQYLSFDDKILGLDAKADVRWTLDALDAPQGAQAVADAPKGPLPAAETPREERLVRIQGVNGDAINVETGPVQATPAQPGWWSAQWLAEETAGPQGRYMAFRNRWKNTYLMVRNGQLVADEPGDPVAGDGVESREEFWRVEGILEDGVILFHPRSGSYMVESNKGAVILSRTRPQGRPGFAIKGVQ